MNYIKQFSLVDQVAIVTGACGGLGRELEQFYVWMGAMLIVVSNCRSNRGDKYAGKAKTYCASGLEW